MTNPAQLRDMLFRSHRDNPVNLSEPITATQSTWDAIRVAYRHQVDRANRWPDKPTIGCVKVTPPEEQRITDFEFTYPTPTPNASTQPAPALEVHVHTPTAVAPSPSLLAQLLKRLRG
jgi:hypothetical protein